MNILCSPITLNPFAKNLRRPFSKSDHSTPFTVADKRKHSPTKPAYTPIPPAPFFHSSPSNDFRLKIRTLDNNTCGRLVGCRRRWNRITTALWELNSPH